MALGMGIAKGVPVFIKDLTVEPSHGGDDLFDHFLLIGLLYFEAVMIFNPWI